VNSRILDRHRKNIRWLLCAAFFMVNPDALAATKAGMLERYAAFKQDHAPGSLPFTLQSTREGKTLSSTVTSFIPSIPFSEFADRLSRASEWCEFIPLHLNVKACMYRRVDGITKLGFYLGTKKYQTPDKSELLLLDFEAGVADGVFLARFTAKKGPYGSSNYDFHFRAIDRDGGIYLEFDLSSQPGMAASLSKLYLATAGRRKIGFSVTETKQDGEVKYVRGQRGASERNIVRYLLAIKTYFEMAGADTDGMQYRRRLERWFDRTEEYHAQLYEMSKSDYLSIKLRERENQRVLIRSLGNPTTPVD